jgi:hypothetical protein
MDMDMRLFINEIRSSIIVDHNQSGVGAQVWFKLKATNPADVIGMMKIMLAYAEAHIDCSPVHQDELKRLRKLEEAVRTIREVR